MRDKGHWDKGQTRGPIFTTVITYLSGGPRLNLCSISNGLSINGSTLSKGILINPPFFRSILIVLLVQRSKFLSRIEKEIALVKKESISS